MHLQVYVIFIIYAISQNFIYTQDFFKVQLSPSTLTSVPYLNSAVVVYQHIQNSSRLFVPPLAVLDPSQTRVLYNYLNRKYVLRLSLILHTNELRTTVLQYLSTELNRCSPSQERCDVKMVPTERLRVVWKRKSEFSSDYKLDTSWQSNTALQNKIDVHIECTTNKTCYELLKHVSETPDILNGLELEYTTQTEKQTRKVVTITGQHVMKTQLYSELKQLPSSTASNHERYLLIDDMNHLITEILTTMELEEMTDSDYITPDDQKILIELLKRRLSLNIEILHGQMERQWNLVYWNSNYIRPDRIIHLLNDEFKQLQNKTSLTQQYESFTQEQQDQRRIDQNRSSGSYDNSQNMSGSNRYKTDQFSDLASSNSTEKKVINQNSKDQSQSHSVYTDHSYSHGDSFIRIGASVPYSQSNTKIDGNSNSHSNYGNNEWRNAFSKYRYRSHDSSHGWEDTQATSNDMSSHNENAWRRATIQDQQTAPDDLLAENHVESFQELRQKNFDFYRNNRQFIEFTGEKFIVKPIKAYKLNLATFQENTKFVHKSIVVSRMDAKHEVAIRILPLSSDVVLTRVSVINNYTSVLQSKLRELSTELKSLITTNTNDSKNLKTDTTNQLEEFKSFITANTDDVEKLKTDTTNQLAEFKSLIIKNTNDVENFKTNTTNQFAEFKSLITTVKQTLSRLERQMPCSSMFLDQTTYSTGYSSNPYSIAVMDVNSDNKPDIVVANGGLKNVGVLLNTGTGTFLTQVTYSTGSSSYSVAVEDVNSDNKPDIVVANYGSSTVGVLINTGTGTFLPQVTYSTGSSPYAITVADVNSDNKPDIVVANSAWNNVGVLINTGTGTFFAQITYSTGSTPYSVAVADVNSDNKPDIVVANYGSSNVGVLINTGTGTFLTQVTYSTGSNPYSVAVVDVNSDNKPDIVVANYGSSNVGVLINTGTGTFLSQVTYSTGTNPRTVAVVDVNNDNKPDIVVTNYASNNVGVLLNRGTGTFRFQVTYSTGSSSSPYSMAVVDMNSDNETDIVVANHATNNVGVLLHC